MRESSGGMHPNRRFVHTRNLGELRSRFGCFTYCKLGHTARRLRKEAAVEVFEAGSVDEWQSVVSDCFIPLTCEAPQGKHRARMEHLSFGVHGSVSALRTAGTIVQRTSQHARSAVNDDLHFSLQLASHGVIRQGRGAVAVAPGSISVYQTNEPYYQDYSTGGQKQLIFQVSRAALGLPAEMMRPALESLRVPATAAARDFFSYIASSQRRVDEDPDLSLEELGVVAVDLAATMLRVAATGKRVIPKTSHGLMHAVESFVDSHLAHVTVNDIAAEFFVSRRWLYSLFERIETTPKEYINGKRIALAAAKLSDPSEAHVSIADIARTSGFPDLTTFSRAFRRTHGMTPREWRGAAAIAQAA